MRPICLLVLLGVAACGQDCPVPTGAAPASCVHFASGEGGESLMVVTPECGIFDQEVQVDSEFDNLHMVLHVDAEGHAPAVRVPSAGLDQAFFVNFSWGDGCGRGFCVLDGGFGPGMECPPQSDPIDGVP